MSKKKAEKLEAKKATKSEPKKDPKATKLTKATLEELGATVGGRPYPIEPETT